MTGVGKAVGSGVEAPAMSLFSDTGTGVLGPERKISGSGSVYGPSSIRLPSFRQSSNLDAICQTGPNRGTITPQDVPMRQYYFGRQFFGHNMFGLVRVRS